MEDYQGTASTSMKLYYPRDIFGDRTGIWDDHSSVGWVGWDVYWSQVAGQRLNMGGSSAYIDHADAVGSTTMETDPAGGVQWDMTHYPWGQIWQQGGTRQTGVYAGLDWQVNDPLLPSATRELSPALGRWMTPDALGGDVTNPQSLNRYAYVGNNPTTFTDPLGLHLPYNFCHNNVGSATCIPGLGYGDWDRSSASGWDEFDLMNATVAGPDAVFVDGGCFGCAPGAELLGLFGTGVENSGWGWEALDASMNLGPPPNTNGGPLDTHSCASRLAQGVQKWTGSSIMNVQFIGLIHGHGNYSFTVPDPTVFQGNLNKHMPWGWAGSLDRGHRFGQILSTHVLDPVNGSYVGHTDLFSGHSIVAPLHWVVDVGFGHIPSVNLDIGCTENP